MILLMIIYSHRITRKKQLIPHARSLMGKHATTIWRDFFEVFNENGHKERKDFFSNNLIQFLWSKFRTGARQEFFELICKVQTTSDDPGKKYMLEIVRMERQTGCEILPPNFTYRQAL